MVSGVGIEAEDPGRLVLRTAMFSFLLLVSRQICEIGFGLSSTVMEMLQIPDAITFEPFAESEFDILPNAGWLIVIIINVVIQWQLVRLFMEVAERYVILCILTYCAPLAFAMGGAKSTSDIFHGWLRMFASMCVLMVFNLFFVKLVLSALSTDPAGAAIIPWGMLCVGIVRMAKKMDGILLRIGMNPALTGDPLGSRIPGMLTAMAIRSIATSVTQTMAQHTPNNGHSATSAPPKSSPAPNGNTSPEVSGSRSAPDTRAGSGARAMHDLSKFRGRYGADAAQQHNSMVSIDADDWEEAKNESAARHNSSGMIARVTPPIQTFRAASADFVQMGGAEMRQQASPAMSAVQTAENNAVSSVESSGTSDTVSVTNQPNVSNAVTPVKPPVSSEQAYQENHTPVYSATVVPTVSAHTVSSVRNAPVSTSQGYSYSDKIHGPETRQNPQSPETRSAARAAIAQVSPLASKADLPSSEEKLPSETAKLPSVSPVGTAADAADLELSSRHSLAASQVTTTDSNQATQQGTNLHASETHITPVRNAVSQASPPVSQANAVAAQHSAKIERLHTVAPLSGNAVTPKQTTKTASVNHGDPSQAASASRGADPALRPTVSPARQERESKTGYRAPRRRNDISPVTQNPEGRPPSMVSPPVTAQPRTLRRSAEPLQKITPTENPRGGTDHQKRRRKK